jgi:hypothetical protein
VCSLPLQKKTRKGAVSQKLYLDFAQVDPRENQLLSPIAQGSQKGHIYYGRMDSNGSAVHAGPEGKKALQSMAVQAIGSGFTLVHVLFDVVDTIKKQVSMPVLSYYIIDCLDRQML